MANSWDLYGRVAIGYKIQEPDHVVYNDQELNVSFGGPVSGFFELGYEKGPFSLGLKHDSQPFVGFPVDDDEEYYKTEVFASVKFYFR